MMKIRRAQLRGRTRLSWLDSHHSFSFGNYYDPAYKGVSALRVINDDRVDPGEGFPMHSHEDMEILTYVKHGVIKHKDSMGNVERVPAGEFQLMAAGTGVRHSEYNPSRKEPLEFLQIWIFPDREGVEPRYQQKRFKRVDGLHPIVTPDGRDDTLQINQDATVYRLILDSGASAEWQLEKDRAAYLHVVSGVFKVADQRLGEADGAAWYDGEELEFTAPEKSEALFFDLPPPETLGAKAPRR